MPPVALGGQSRQVGFTVIEVSVAATMFAGLVLIMTTLLDSSAKSDATMRAKGSILSQAAYVIDRIVADVRISGMADISGTPVPATVDSVAGSPPVAQRGLVLATPSDVDQNREPDLLDARILWSTDVLEYVIETRGDDVCLVRRHGAIEEVLSHQVVQVLFDTPESSGFTVPYGCIRVRLELDARSHGSGREARSFETTVRLGVEAPL